MDLLNPGLTLETFLNPGLHIGPLNKIPQRWPSGDNPVHAKEIYHAEKL